VSLAAAEAPGERVDVVTIDGMGLTSCGLIKIDVEGFEREVLAGARATVATHRPTLYVENDRPQHQREIIALLDEMGYRPYWHTPRMVTSGNFNGVGRMVFNDDYKSLNVLCIPAERSTQTDLEPIDPADPRMPGSVDAARPPVGVA